MRLLPSLICSVIAIIIPIAGWAQQPAPASAQPAGPQDDKAPPAPGRYIGTIFTWQTTVTVASVDKEGQIRGSLTSCPNEIRRRYGLQCSTVEFNSRPGGDGLPEHIAPRPITNDSSASNDYSRIRACGEDLCTSVSRMVGREDGKGDEKVDVDIKLAKQAAGTAPTAEQTPPAPPMPFAPPGFARPGMPLVSGAPPTQAGPPPLPPPMFARPGMPGVSGMPPTQAGPPPLPPAPAVTPTPQDAAPPSPK
jgi:hypothetical protein